MPRKSAIHRVILRDAATVPTGLDMTEWSLHGTGSMYDPWP
jgi:hypothetical protein